MCTSLQMSKVETIESKHLQVRSGNTVTLFQDLMQVYSVLGRERPLGEILPATRFFQLSCVSATTSIV